MDVSYVMAWLNTGVLILRLNYTHTFNYFCIYSFLFLSLLHTFTYHRISFFA